MMQLTLISLVEIISMLMPAAASAWNIFAATPAWERMPTPTMETFATSSPNTMLPPPSSLTTCLSFSTARFKSVEATVNEMSFLPMSCSDED